LPHLVEMHDKWASRGLAVITIDVDPPEEAQSVDEALAFLQRREASLINVIVADAPDKASWLSKKKVDVFPHIDVYDRKGKLRKTFIGPSERELEKLVGELLDS
jgi:hypothetical protein